MIGNKEVTSVSIYDIIPNRFQPRLAFDEDKLNELSESIKQHGIIQPLLLRKIGEKFEIIAGERRYKAATIAGLNNVPAIIVEVDDGKSAEIAITENIQRKDLTAIEEAQSYKKLLNNGNTQDEIAKKLGISQSAVANKLRLLSLSEEVQNALLNNKISERHARALLKVPTLTIQINLLNKIINEKLNVRETEEEIEKILNPESLNTENTIEEFKIEDFESPKFEDNILEQQPIKEITEDEEDYEILTPFSEIKDYQKEEDFFENVIEPKKENTEVKKDKDFTEIIDKIRNLKESLNTEGYDLSLEEFNFDDIYQIIIKIRKDE